jgi:YD repeat-containing protein
MEARTCLFGLLCIAGNASAIEASDEYASRPPAGEVVQSLGDGLFGDVTSYYSGATTFAVTDVRLPGNSTLPVAIGRTHTVGSRGGRFGEQYDGPHGAGAFGEWDIDLPSLRGVFSMLHRWQVVGDAPDARCSAPHSAATMRPPDMDGFQGDAYWGGHTLHIPGLGDQRVLLAATPLSARPQGNATYRWNTSQHWYLSCTTLKNGVGEGFVAHAPDGTTYHFDWMVYQRTAPLLKWKLDKAVERMIGFLYPTRVEDRFGNRVTYTWSGDQLQSIVASDGRSLSLGYTHVGTGLSAGPKVTSVTDGTRTWRYDYASNASLQKVTLPDGSAWQLQTAVPWFETHDTQAGQSEDGCLTRWITQANEFTYRMTHPSGAVGEFVFAPTEHGRARVFPKCQWNKAREEDANRSAGQKFFAISLKRKKIGGPGMHDRSWSLTYNGQLGSWSDCTTCNTIKSAEVIDNAGQATRYFFSMHFGVSEGRLIEMQEGTATQSLRKTFHYYDTADHSPAPAYQRVLGQAGDYWGKSPTDESQLPQSGGDVVQEGFTYSWRVRAFDALARPLRVDRFNAHNSRTDTTQHHDDTTRWVLGQPSRTTTNDIETTRTTFDPATALPVQVFEYGKLRAATTYHADGTVASITDGNGHATHYAQWKRGRPQWVQFPPTPEAPGGATRTAVVNDDGTLASETDERGSKTCYAHDSMGRLARITHPSESRPGTCDASAWAPTTIDFSPGHGAAYGLPAGHWRQTTQTGNARHVVLFDALWRPVVEQTMDLADPGGTTREVIKRYDASGRLAFESYPMNAGGGTHHLSTPLHGIGTRYDVLGRVTHVDQDSELGKLTTMTEYLSGSQVRTTNPRGHATTTSHQVFDAPDDTAPTVIQHPGDVRTEIERDVFGKPLRITRSGPEG